VGWACAQMIIGLIERIDEFTFLIFSSHTHSKPHVNHLLMLEYPKIMII